MKKLNVKEAGYMVAKAWDEVTDSNIKNAWNKLLKNQQWTLVQEPFYDDVMLNIIQRIAGYFNCTFDDVKSWILTD